MISEKAYRYYSTEIFPKVKGIRGFTRLKFALRELALSKLEKVREKEELDPFSRDWENLIIIDSCRQDFFEEETGYNGSRHSLASATPEYIEKNFSEGDFTDYVYIAGNPFFSETRFKEITGRERLEVFHTVFETFDTGWDDETGIVDPEKTIEDALTAQKLFPEKKLIIHFMPPHYPFITPLFEDDKDVDPWVLAENGELDPERAISAYKDSIQYIAPKVENLADELKGKTILTSDHANFVGEAGVYGHPKYRNEKAVKRVPWIEL